MLQKYSTFMQNYIQIAYKKTVDILLGVWYHIDKEKETENLGEPKGKKKSWIK